MSRAEQLAAQAHQAFMEEVGNSATRWNFDSERLLARHLQRAIGRPSFTSVKGIADTDLAGDALGRTWPGRESRRIRPCWSVQPVRRNQHIADPARRGRRYVHCHVPQFFANVLVAAAQA